DGQRGGPDLGTERLPENVVVALLGSRRGAGVDRRAAPLDELLDGLRELFLLLAQRESHPSSAPRQTVEDPRAVGRGCSPRTDERPRLEDPDTQVALQRVADGAVHLQRGAR